MPEHNNDTAIFDRSTTRGMMYKKHCLDIYFKIEHYVKKKKKKSRMLLHGHAIRIIEIFFNNLPINAIKCVLILLLNYPPFRIMLLDKLKGN